MFTLLCNHREIQYWRRHAESRFKASYGSFKRSLPSSTPLVPFRKNITSRPPNWQLLFDFLIIEASGVSKKKNFLKLKKCILLPTKYKCHLYRNLSFCRGKILKNTSSFRSLSLLNRLFFILVVQTRKQMKICRHFTLVDKTIISHSSSIILSEFLPTYHFSVIIFPASKRWLSIGKISGIVIDENRQELFWVPKT